MGRGLVTLHQRGEDLNAAPMSIGDLIGVASYHFRKSYLGVLQTSRSHPELGEKLLMNQIGWNDMLMRLFKTRDKLENSEFGIRNAELPMTAGQGDSKDQGARIEGPENEEGRRMKEELASGSVLPLNSGAASCGMALPESRERAFSAPSAFAERGAFGAPRAFSSYDRKTSISGSRSSNQGQTKENSAAGKTISGGAYDENEKRNDPVKENGNLKNENRENGKPEGENETPVQMNETPGPINQEAAKTGNGNPETGERNDPDKENGNPETGERNDPDKENGALKNKNREPGTPEAENQENSMREDETPEKWEDRHTKAEGSSAEDPHIMDTGHGFPVTEGPVPELRKNEIPDPEKRDSEIPAEKDRPQENFQAKDPDPPVERRNAADPIHTPKEPPDEEVNPYLELEIRTALKCDPKVWDEIKFYMMDPFFMRRHPEHATVFRKLLREKTDSS